jgi:hypothetical protein
LTKTPSSSSSSFPGNPKSSSLSLSLCISNKTKLDFYKVKQSNTWYCLLIVSNVCFCYSFSIRRRICACDIVYNLS